MRAIQKFSTSISQINNSTRKQGISVSRLFKLLDRRSNYILTFVAFFLVVIPLPTPPGFSTILALPAIFISIQICCFNKVYLPKWLAQIRINKNFIKKIDHASKRYLIIIENLTKQRFSITTSSKLQKIYNVVLLILALASAVPVPFLCMVPASAGVLMSAGLIVKDGLLTVLSLLIGGIGISLIYLTIKTLVLIRDYLPL